MKLTERAEEMLETLWIQLVELKKKGLDVSILRDDETLEFLIANSYLKKNKDMVVLTSRGKEEGKNCVRRHRLAERLLTDVLDVRGNMVHQTSCKFEHFLHKGIDDNICTLLGHPKTCPHGKTIPPGKCCKNLKKNPEKIIVTLADFDTRKKAKVAYLQTTDHDMLQKLIAMGVLPNTEIKLLRKFPSIIFEIGISQFAIDKQLASHIYVRSI